jgi:hypothetical protein
MGNSQSLPELPPTYEEFQRKYHDQVDTTPSCSSSHSVNNSIRYNSCSTSNTIRSNAYSTSSTLPRPNQPLHADSIEAKLSDLRGKPDTLGQLLNCKKEDYDSVKELLEMEKNIAKRREKLEKHILNEMKKIDKMEKDRDKKLKKIQINR